MLKGQGGLRLKQHAASYGEREGQRGEREREELCARRGREAGDRCTLRHIGNPVSTHREKEQEARALLDSVRKQLKKDKMTGHLVLDPECRVHTALCIG